MAGKAPKTESKPTLFTTIGAVSSTRPLTYKDVQERGWPMDAFMMNRAFSLSEDSVLAAHLLNQRPHLWADAHITFYVNTLRARRRFEKWPKTLKDDQIRIIAQFYGMSYREAAASYGIHSEEDIAEMRRVLDDGAQPTRWRNPVTRRSVGITDR